MEEAAWLQGRYVSGKDVTNHRREGIDWKCVKKHELYIKLNLFSQVH